MSICNFENISNLVVGMDQEKEGGQHLGVDEEVAEEPTLSRRGDGQVECPQVLPVTLVTCERVEHLTVLPIHPGLILQTEGANEEISYNSNQ